MVNERTFTPGSDMISRVCVERDPGEVAIAKRDQEDPIVIDLEPVTGYEERP
jgi:hypothetical protein